MPNENTKRRRPNRLASIIVAAVVVGGLAAFLGQRALEWYERRALHREYRVEESVARCIDAMRRLLGEPKVFRPTTKEYGVMELMGFVVARGEVEFGPDASALRRGNFSCFYDPKCDAIMEFAAPGHDYDYGAEEAIKQLNATLYGKAMGKVECMQLRARLRGQQ